MISRQLRPLQCSRCFFYQGHSSLYGHTSSPSGTSNILISGVPRLALFRLGSTISQNDHQPEDMGILSLCHNHNSGLVYWLENVVQIREVENVSWSGQEYWQRLPNLDQKQDEAVRQGAGAGSGEEETKSFERDGPNALSNLIAESSPGFMNRIMSIPRGNDVFLSLLGRGPHLISYLMLLQGYKIECTPFSQRQSKHCWNV